MTRCELTSCGKYLITLNDCVSILPLSSLSLLIQLFVVVVVVVVVTPFRAALVSGCFHP